MRLENLGIFSLITAAHNCRYAGLAFSLNLVSLKANSGVRAQWLSQEILESGPHEALGRLPPKVPEMDPRHAS